MGAILIAVWLDGMMPIPLMLPPRRHCDRGFAIGNFCDECADGTTADDCHYYGLKRKNER